MYTQIEQALAVFAVASWANTDDSVATANQEIDEYVATCATSGHHPLQALQALDMAYVWIMTDSSAGKSIRLALQKRIAILRSAEPLVSKAFGREPNIQSLYPEI